MNYNNLFIESNTPRSLPKKQIFSYFEKYKHGDMEARENIIVQNIRLVLYQVRNKFANAPYDKEELVSRQDV